MIIVQINATCGVGSTGKICVEVSKLLSQKGIENYIFYCGRKSDYPLGLRYADASQIKREALRSHINGRYGFNSQGITRQLLRQLDRLRPDIVHLHNLHGHNCDLEMLFQYLKEKHIRTFWTFHDCWAFTAYCPHFVMTQCGKWREGCHDCPRYHEFSFFFDRSKELYQKKKDLISGMDLTIITPSQWLADLVKQSFLHGYPVEVIHNGIDLTVFKPTASDFREKYHIPMGKNILLGVAFDWSGRKGLDVFVKLAARLDPDKYQIVLTGTNDRVDRLLPPQIISIHRTSSRRELAEIYTAADLFVNPTREEVFGLVNVEALACGTPGVAFDTGGSPECYDETCGSVVPCDDVDVMGQEIVRICEKKPFNKKACIERAMMFDSMDRYQKYLELYI